MRGPAHSVLGWLRSAGRQSWTSLGRAARHAVLSAATLGVGVVGASGADGSWPPTLALEPVVTAGLQSPVYVTHARDGRKRLFAVEQPGRVRVIENGRLLKTAFLDITRRVQSGGERGLLGLAFHPGFRANRRYVVYYTRAPDGATVVAEFRVSSDPNVSEATEERLLTVPQPYANHNGGMVEFGPDGFLYVGLGDGGGAGDPGNRAQNPHELLGKILRIDVDGPRPYAIPPGNPFAATNGRPEIFASGFRNPWRFSFDQTAGALWVADVGQSDWEEIDVVQRGGNYGWRIREGNHCFRPRHRCPTAGLVPPLAEYRSDRSRCSIIGGYVYRGRRIPHLVGTYVFGDYCSGEVFGLGPEGQRLLLATDLRIASFGRDEDGELLVIGHGGTGYQKQWFSRTPDWDQSKAFGQRLRGTVHRIVGGLPHPGR